MPAMTLIRLVVFSILVSDYIRLVSSADRDSGKNVETGTEDERKESIRKEHIANAYNVFDEFLKMYRDCLKNGITKGPEMWNEMTFVEPSDETKLLKNYKEDLIQHLACIDWFVNTKYEETKEKIYLVVPLYYQFLCTMFSVDFASQYLIFNNYQRSSATSPDKATMDSINIVAAYLRTLARNIQYEDIIEKYAMEEKGHYLALLSSAKAHYQNIITQTGADLATILPRQSGFVQIYTGCYVSVTLSGEINYQKNSEIVYNFNNVDSSEQNIEEKQSRVHVIIRKLFEMRIEAEEEKKAPQASGGKSIGASGSKSKEKKKKKNR